MDGPPMTFVFHHGGKFKKDEGENLYYELNNTEVLMGVDSDTLDVFFVNGYFKELGYAEARECLWKSCGVLLESGLKRLATDDDLVAMVKDYRRNFNLINLYFEHGVSKPFVVDEKEKDVEKKKPSQTKKQHSQPTKPPSHPKACSQSSQPSKLPSQSTKKPTQPTKVPSQPTMLKPDRPTKRRRDKGEQPSGSSTKMKRKYNPIRCMYCSKVGHIKRGCAKKKQVDAEEQARQMQLQLALVKEPAPATDETNTNNDVQFLALPPPPVQPQPEVTISQPEGSPPIQVTQQPVEDLQDAKRGRPPKLHVIKRKAKLNASTKSLVAISAETLKGTSSATAKKMQSFMTFVPTPGFKHPRKKD